MAFYKRTPSNNALYSGLLISFLLFLTIVPFAIADSSLRPSSINSQAELEQYLQNKVPPKEWASELKRIGKPSTFPVKALAGLFRRDLKPPVEIDIITKLTEINAEKPDTIVFVYSIDLLAEKAEQADWYKVRSSALRVHCSDVSMGPWFKRGYKLKMLYNSRENSLVYETVMSAADCKTIKGEAPK